MKIQILLSTYNGERFLRQQLDSFFAQTIMDMPGWELGVTVRDDGSTDGTIRILEEYANLHAEMRIVQGENIGVIDSFLELIGQTPEDVDYFALSDQDDVWMKDKLEKAVQCLQKKKDIPLLYCNMPKLTDENMQPITSIMYTENMHPAFGNALVENICTGCTAVFNQELARILRLEKPAFTVMHDWWLYLVASCFGEVIFDAIPHIYYRQHRANTVGVQKNYWNEFVARVKRFRGNRYNISRQVESLRVFCEHARLQPEEEKMQLMQDILLSRKSVRKRIQLVKNSKVYRQRKGDNLIFKWIMMLGTM